MELLWKYVEDQFQRATKTSYSKALKLSNYHDSALHIAASHDPIFQPLHDRYHLLHQNFIQKYNEWVSAGGSQSGKTLNVKQQLKIAKDKFDVWNGAIQAVYPKTSPEYKAILPNGRKPFYKGGVDKNINAFNILSMNIGADPSLAAVRAEVDATYLLLDTARDNQEGAKAEKKHGSGNVETARIAIMSMQYRNAGWVMDNMYDTRITLCEAMFDLLTLRDKQQSHFTASLGISENKPILVRTFIATDVLRLKLDGDGPVVFYLASTQGGTDSTPITRNSNQDMKATISEFNVPDYGTHRHLTAINQSGVVTHIVVDVM